MMPAICIRTAWPSRAVRSPFSRRTTKQGQILQIGGAPEKEKDQVYVRFAARGFVYTLPNKIEAILNTKPNDLRDRHLVRIDQTFSIASRLTLPEKAKPSSRARTRTGRLRIAITSRPTRQKSRGCSTF